MILPRQKMFAASQLIKQAGTGFKGFNNAVMKSKAQIENVGIKMIGESPARQEAFRKAVNTRANALAKASNRGGYEVKNILMH